MGITQYYIPKRRCDDQHGKNQVGRFQAKYVDGGTTIGWIRINHISFKSILIRLAWLNRGGRGDWKSQRLSSSAVTLSSYIRTNSGKHVRVSATRSSWDNLHKNKTNDTWRTYIYIYIYIHVAYIYIYMCIRRKNEISIRNGAPWRMSNCKKNDWKIFELSDLECAHSKHPFYSSQHALGWSGEFAVSVRSPSEAYDSLSDLLCLLVVWISQRWVVTYVAQWFSPVVVSSM